ncbi:glycosyltransferase [Adhaeretor mobilis]|uniref:Teichuronic acid biosynthesis glycosyltransferase TuaC n=1 Tax=Adhaeretor mobilis TaxID=1930276 RepID=A0A517MY55_9BACT|nr:glycosyltransferase [Adhaeretor mobilis]QDS99804.1 Putative teichuronic acid biosynthesis glycosyltransferase TuaC [Adhaeretor mobilis]
MKVLWTHNYSPTCQSSGVFMFLLADAMKEVGVDVHLHYTGSLRNAWRLRRTTEEIAELSRKFDIAHAQFGSACSLVTSRAVCPKIVSLRGTDLLGSDTGGLVARLHGRVVCHMTRRALPAYERVIVMSDRMRAELALHHRRNHEVEVIPDGIDLHQFQPMDRREARHRLGLTEDTRPWVLFASLHSNNPLKRPQLAREAVAAAAGKRPEIVLKTLTGQSHDQVALWMNAANVLLLTSTREGWPNVVKEAIACNTPFVATDVSDLVEIARVEASCTVAEATPSALAKGILHAIDSPRPTDLHQQMQSMNMGAIALKIRSLYEQVSSRTPIAA